MLYLKLIIRGVLRHQKRGKRLFVLIALCVAAIIFSLAFKDSFYQQYLAQGINMWTGHLTVVSPKSPLVQSDAMEGADTQDLPLIHIDKEFEQYVSGLEHVEKASPQIETYMSFFTLEGDALITPDEESEGEGNNYGPLTALRPEDMSALFPQKQVIEGQAKFDYEEGMTDIPVLRQKLNDREKEVMVNNSRFIRNNFRYQNQEWENFKEQVKQEFPSLFDSKTSIASSAGTENFINILNRAIKDKNFYTILPAKYNSDYNWQIDDLTRAIQALDGNSGTERDLALLNKKLLQAIYPKAITPILEEVTLNKPITALTSSAVASSSQSESYIVMPIKFVGIVTAMPMFQRKSCVMDVRALQKYLKLQPDEYTGYVIRLTDKEYTPVVQKQISEYLVKRGLDYKVIDYAFTGKDYLPLAEAFDIIFSVLIVLFTITTIIFTVNLVMLSIIKRRREIGTAITMGLGKTENILLFMGEIGFILTLSWVLGAVLGSGLIFLFSRIGIPGMFFFANDKLYFLFNPEHLLIAYLILLPAGLLAALLPSLSIYKINPRAILQESN